MLPTRQKLRSGLLAKVAQAGVAAGQEQGELVPMQM